jgi:acetyl esterase/lipase
VSSFLVPDHPVPEIDLMKSIIPRQLGSILLLLTVTATGLTAAERRKVMVTSSADHSEQPCYLILPSSYLENPAPAPLLVSLHTWSGDVEQRNMALEAESEKRGWIYLFPNFRGANRHPDACGSPLAQQDILDAVDWACRTEQVDLRRIYLTGVSGGGHMTMLMVGRHPDRWAAASAWVGISDLAAWYHRHKDGNYGRMMQACCGGGAGESWLVDRQYRQRSPLTRLRKSLPVPLDIAAGVHDGHSGSVPVRHSLEAFNEIARAAGARKISEEEIKQIGAVDGRLLHPAISDQVNDPSLGREIYLRRHAGRSRVTIFEGGHEGIATAATAWLSQFQKPTIPRIPRP